MRFILCRAAEAYLFVILARIVLSCFPISPAPAMPSVYSFLYAITEPILAPIRRVIPPTGMGGMGLDWSPMIVTFGLFFIQRAVCA